MWMIGGGVLIGLGLTWLILKIYRRIPDNENIATVISLVTPYVLYIVTEKAGASGVLAVVCGGVCLSVRRTTIFTSSVRLFGQNIWEHLTFLLNGFAFMVIGLDLNEIISSIRVSGQTYGL